ncbi:sensor histidine kinase [Amycolatopsis sp. NPDC059021]|uniref:sensor histidine kinase n=1 Tax=Amycolatopsis sp. NPDC059021 TaxID=3346704 RepID=UPI00366EE059
MIQNAGATRHGPDWLAAGRTATLVLLSFAGGLALLYGVLESGPGGVARVLDVAVGALASLALVLRNRAPVVVAVTLAAVASVVASAGFANMLALYAVARRRRLWVALAVAVMNVVSGCVFWLVYSGNNSLSLTIVVNAAMAAAFSAWGALQQAQHKLVDFYRERAERAEQEQELRAAEARYAERARIAREMHDAVAHRISLVTLHAGGLTVANGLSQDEVRSAGDLIRSAAVQALEELRTALGVLRADEAASLEQPGLDRLDDLVGEARAAGQRITLTVHGDLRDAPPGIGRAAYRIVQEGLTNARKHATGADVTVLVNRTDDMVRVRVGNRVVADALDVPGSRRGLLGLRERAVLAGGSLSHGRTDAGEFVLNAELPWT